MEIKIGWERMIERLLNSERIFIIEKNGFVSNFMRTSVPGLYKLSDLPAAMMHGYVFHEVPFVYNLFMALFLEIFSFQSMLNLLTNSSTLFSSSWAKH
jgi:hypothetical protein